MRKQKLIPFEDLHESSRTKQFPINFPDGTIYADPAKFRRNEYGDPVLDHHWYVKNHLPHKLEEYEQQKVHNLQRHLQLDKDVLATTKIYGSGVMEEQRPSNR